MLETWQNCWYIESACVLVILINETWKAKRKEQLYGEVRFSTAFEPLLNQFLFVRFKGGTGKRRPAASCWSPCWRFLSHWRPTCTEIRWEPSSSSLWTSTVCWRTAVTTCSKVSKLSDWTLCSCVRCVQELSQTSVCLNSLNRLWTRDVLGQDAALPGGHTVQVNVVYSNQCVLSLFLSK